MEPATRICWYLLLNAGKNWRSTTTRGVLSLVFLLGLTLALPANTLYGPGEALSTDGRAATGEREPEISAMGAIARGDVPMPDVEELRRRAARRHPTRGSAFGCLQWKRRESLESRSR